MSVYSNIQISDAISNGKIVCIPFDKNNVKEAGLDVTLGYYYFRINESNTLLYNPCSEYDVNKVFLGPYKANSHITESHLQGFAKLQNIPDEHPIIIIKPYERILAHTHEFFGIYSPGAYQLKCRSSWSRNGITVTGDAGWVEPGYTNRLSMQIQNTNPFSIVIPVGERIAQAIFFETGKVDGNYTKNREYNGKYQTTYDLKTTISSWDPSQILPKAYKDKRVMPVKISDCIYE